MLRLFFSIFFLILLSACTITGEKTGPVVSSEVSKDAPYQATLDAETKIELAKKRKSYMSGIRKGDYYSLRNNSEEALSYYLQVAEKLPNDLVVRKKIAHVYVLQKNWKAAYENYVQVPILELSATEKSEMIQSLFFDAGQIDRIGEILKMPFSTGEVDYYRVVDVCSTGIHSCVVTIDSYSGTQFDILDLQSTIRDASHISPDTEYRNITLAAKFYEQGMYAASARITREILQSRPDYLEAMKIYGFSLFELGEYADAKKSLLSYLEKNPNDLESLARMGDIYSHLGDIVSSNLALNNAIIAGYTPKTDLERKLAYNYHLLGDAPGLMKVMNYLLQEEDVREDDYAVGVSFSLSEGDNLRARNWAEDGLRKFPLSPMLTPLYIEALRLSGERDLAQNVIENSLSTPIAENPNFSLQQGILYFELARYQEAKEVFESLMDMDEWPGVVEEASLYLQSIETTLSASGGLFD